MDLGNTDYTQRVRSTTQRGTGGDDIVNQQDSPLSVETRSGSKQALGRSFLPSATGGPGLRAVIGAMDQQTGTRQPEQIRNFTRQKFWLIKTSPASSADWRWRPRHDVNPADQRIGGDGSHSSAKHPQAFRLSTVLCRHEQPLHNVTVGSDSTNRITAVRDRHQRDWLLTDR
jgi:hypothetical protein